MAFNPQDQGCRCLPGYVLNSGRTACIFDTATVGKCSSFTFAVTDGLRCHSGVYFCNVNTTGLNGECTEMLTNTQWQQCQTAQTNFSCNCNAACSSSCIDSNACYGCCTCTPTQTLPPRPTCP